MKTFTKLLYLPAALLLICFLLIFLPFILEKHIDAIKIDSEIETNEWFQNRVQKYTIIRCESGLLRGLYGFVYENKFKTITDEHIHFYQTMRDSIFSWTFNTQYTGGTTVKNTTFPELVKMVKKDCSQFQDSYFDKSELGDTTGMNDFEKTERWHETEFKNIRWTYSPYEPRPPEKHRVKRTEEQSEALRQQIIELYKD